MLLAVAHDFVAVFLPLLLPGCKTNPNEDPLYIALRVHCLYVSLLMLRKFTVELLLHLQDLCKEPLLSPPRPLLS